MLEAFKKRGGATTSQSTTKRRLAAGRHRVASTAVSFCLK